MSWPSLPWYIWVWGIASTLALLVVIVLGIVGILYYLETRKAKEQILELRAEIRGLENKWKEEKVVTSTLKAQLQEVRKGQNEFGRISP